MRTLKRPNVPTCQRIHVQTWSRATGWLPRRGGERAPDLATLRGVEGAGSKAYFALLRSVLRSDFVFEKRTRRPPHDPTNTLLSLGYTLLGEALAASLEVVGLDPYEGFYHADKYGRPALALDLLEEFSGPVADSVALTLIDKRMLDVADFEAATEDGEAGVYLSRQRPGCLSARVQRAVADDHHPPAGGPATLLSEMPGGAGPPGRPAGDGGGRRVSAVAGAVGEDKVEVKVEVEASRVAHHLDRVDDLRG